MTAEFVYVASRPLSRGVQPNPGYWVSVDTSPLLPDLEHAAGFDWAVAVAQMESAFVEIGAKVLADVAGARTPCWPSFAN
jgi:hypothetical protein